MTYHPDGDPRLNSSTWFHEDAWLTANGVEVWRDVDQVYGTMSADYQRTPVKPSLFLEGSYEFGSYKHECGWVTPLKARRQIYHTFFAGGAGHTYGAGPIWAMRGNAGDYNCGYTWRQALAFPGALQFAGVAKAFLITHQWSRWLPDRSMLDEALGEGESLRPAVTYANRRVGLVDLSNNATTTIKNALAQSATATWFDPRNGQEEPAGRLQASESRDMTPPTKWEDAILILRKHDG